jgi:hypothetical protein
MFQAADGGKRQLTEVAMLISDSDFIAGSSPATSDGALQLKKRLFPAALEHQCVGGWRYPYDLR